LVKIVALLLQICHTRVKILFFATSQLISVFTPSRFLTSDDVELLSGAKFAFSSLRSIAPGNVRPPGLTG
jgi:hypothetical protein